MKLILGIALTAWLIYSWNCRNNTGDECLFALPIKTT
jgi:hypothetical protein